MERWWFCGDGRWLLGLDGIVAGRGVEGVFRLVLLWGRWLECGCEELEPKKNLMETQSMRAMLEMINMG